MFENDYTINGKHATYLKFLAKKNSRDDQSPDNPTAARLFERYIDVYMNAAVFGLLYSRTAKRDTTSDDRARVYADAFANERENCIFLYRMVMLLDKTTELTSEERIDRAFRYDSQPEKPDVICLGKNEFRAFDILHRLRGIGEPLAMYRGIPVVRMTKNNGIRMYGKKTESEKPFK